MSSGAKPSAEQRADILLVEDRGPVRWLTLNRPEVRNALNDAVLGRLQEALRDARDQPGLRAVVLTGAGTRAFCAGGDLKPGSDMFIADPARPTTPLGDVFRAALALDVPLVARINGHCLAGGMGLLAMCDLAIASDQALFGLPEVRIGLFPMQVAALLSHLIPQRAFAELCLTGQPVSASHAQALGLINHVTTPDGLDARTEALVAQIVGNAPTAIRRGKAALRAMRGMSIDQSIAFMESQIASLPLTQDAREGMAAFNEKRPPDWTGR